MVEQTSRLAGVKRESRIMAEENKAVYEHLLKSAIEGMKWEVYVISQFLHEFPLTS